MPNPSYRKGARLERLARLELERQGYTVVRSAGSKGAVDLVALNVQGVRLIQVKAAGQVEPADERQLAAVAAQPGSRREIWERSSSPAGWKIREVHNQGGVFVADGVPAPAPEKSRGPRARSSAGLRQQLERVSDLQSQASPENFWCDGEKPHTPANVRQWERLQGRCQKAEERARAGLAAMPPDGRKAVLARLPEPLRFTAEILLLSM